MNSFCKLCKLGVIWLVLAWTGIPAVAHASFGDCADPVYLARFDTAAGSGSFDCLERLRLPVESLSGTRHIRILHHRFSDWMTDEAMLGNFDRGVRAAATALGSLGGIRMQDITVLLIDGPYPGDGADVQQGNIVGMMLPSIDGECRIVLYLLSDGSDPAFAAPIVVHEIFHCVQQANLNRAQARSGGRGTGRGGDWWIEGSAEWFVALALTETNALADRVATFDRESAERPLTRMAYGAFAFFLWLGNERGPEGILPFLHGMAGDSSEAAQRAAMRAALTPNEWLLFAQDYLDGRLRHPHGSPLDFRPQDGEDRSWSSSSTEIMPAEPFQIIRGHLSFACGSWQLKGQPDPAHAQRPATGGAWQALPATMEPRDASQRYRYLGFKTGPELSTAIHLTAERLSACGECAAVSGLDACMLGSWTMTKNGMMDAMRRKLPSSMQINSSSQAQITLREDGTYAMAPVAVHSNVRDTRGAGVLAQGQLQAAQTGRWSAQDGQFNLCIDAAGLTADIRLSGPDGGINVPLPPEGPRVQRQRYRCEADQFYTQMDVQGLGSVQYEFTRTVPGE